MTAATAKVQTKQEPIEGAMIDVLLRGWGVVAVGALIGITWCAALRAYMVGLAGPASAFSWWGTFAAILLPGGVAGALLAVAWRRGAQGRASAWFALAPTPLALVPLLEPGALIALLTTGLGGGAAGVVATGLIGGVAAGQRGPVWVRAALGAVWVALLAGFAITPALVARLPLTTPRGAWLTVLTVGLIALLSLACVAPFLRRGAPDGLDPTA